MYAVGDFNRDLMLRLQLRAFLTPEGEFLKNVSIFHRLDDHLR